MTAYMLDGAMKSYLVHKIAFMFMGSMGAVVVTNSIKCKDYSRIAKTGHKTSMYSKQWCPT
jgi:hypothetical protein